MNELFFSNLALLPARQINILLFLNASPVAESPEFQWRSEFYCLVTNQDFEKFRKKDWGKNPFQRVFPQMFKRNVSNGFSRLNAFFSSVNSLFRIGISGFAVAQRRLYHLSRRGVGRRHERHRLRYPFPRRRYVRRRRSVIYLRQFYR